MANLTDFAEIALLELLFGDVPLVLPASWEIALHTADPTDGGTAAEIQLADWPNYVRATVGRSIAADWTTPAPESGGGHLVTNVGLIDFGTPTGVASPAPVAAYFTLRDDADEAWFWGELSEPKTIVEGSPVTFTAGDLGFGFR